MAGLRRYIAMSDHWSAKAARRMYCAMTMFSVPAPRLITWPVLQSFLLGRGIYYFLIRVFVCEPLFKAYCRRFGKRVRTGVYVHWVQGKGDLILGDDVLVDGKCNFSFAARYVEMPVLQIGSHCHINHGCSFTVAKKIEIGDYCRIARGVWMFDASGHPTDPAARRSGMPTPVEKVRPIRIGDNVWIGTDAIICPGVIIGEGSVVAAGSMVTKDVPPNTFVAGNPAKIVRSLQTASKEELSPSLHCGD